MCNKASIICAITVDLSKKLFFLAMIAEEEKLSVLFAVNRWKEDGDDNLKMNNLALMFKVLRN